MPTTPNINKILAKESVSSGYGAPMGARNIVEKSSLPLLLQRVDLVDGDYSKDGTYWGSGGEPLWCAFNQEDDNHAPAMGTRVYVRALNWNVAAQRVRDIVGEDTKIEQPKPSKEDVDFLRGVIESYDKGEANKDMLDFAASVAARAGLESELEDLLRCGVDPNAQNGAGDTLLMIAAKAGSRECAQVLLRFGADPHAKMEPVRTHPESPGKLATWRSRKSSKISCEGRRSFRAVFTDTRARMRAILMTTFSAIRNDPVPAWRKTWVHIF